MYSPCYKVKAVGATGAGDCAIAGFLTGMLKRLDPFSVMNSAVAVGACNVEAADAVSGIKSWEETQERIRCGWQKYDPVPHVKEWTWNENHQIAIGSADHS
jgi:sugar/nucleoside kinase (ribokinase family)